MWVWMNASWMFSFEDDIPEKTRETETSRAMNSRVAEANELQQSRILERVCCMLLHSIGRVLPAEAL